MRSLLDFVVQVVLEMLTPIADVEWGCVPVCEAEYQRISLSQWPCHDLGWTSNIRIRTAYSIPVADRKRAGQCPVYAMQTI
jgi:hypothetical protein